MQLVRQSIAEVRKNLTHASDGSLFHFLIYVCRSQSLQGAVIYLAGQRSEIEIARFI